MKNIHASCVVWRRQGILFLGDSGSGKSDLCLRMIMNKQARLVADDRVNIWEDKKNLYASCPETTKGLLEVRGLGIFNFSSQKKCRLALAVRLMPNREDIERYPENEFYEYEGVKIPQIKLYSFDVSSPEKVLLSLSINQYKS